MRTIWVTPRHSRTSRVPGLLIPSEIAHHSDFKSPVIPK